VELPKLQIGQTYLVPDTDGEEVEGVLEDAVVMESEKRVYGTYRLRDGRKIICANPLNDQELREYQDDPDNFFGVFKSVPKNLTNYEEAFQFLWSTYRNTTKAKLLEFMAEAPDIEELKKRSQKSLSRLYCERVAVSMTADIKDKFN